MAIGTTFKLGWDATKVNRGMNSMRGSMRRTSRSMARGMRSAFRSSFAKIGTAFAAIFAGRKIAALMTDTANWVDNIHDLATGANVAASEIVKLEGAFAAAGIKMRDNSRALNEFAANLYEAQTKGGPAREGMNRLGIFAPDVDPNDIVGMFQKIGRAMSDANKSGAMSNAALAKTAEDIFGSSAGFKLLKLFNNPDMFKNVSAELDELGKMVEDRGKSIAEFTDEWAIAKMKLTRGIGMGLLQGFPLNEIVRSLNEVDWIRIGQIMGDAIKRLSDVLKNPKAVLDEWLAILEAAAKWFGRMIATEIGNILKPGFMDKQAPTFQEVLGEILERNASTSSTSVLEDIRSGVNGTKQELAMIRRGPTNTVF